MAAPPVCSLTEGGRKERRTTVEREERTFLSGLQNALDSTESDLAYIQAELKGPQRRHVQRVASVLRQGLNDTLFQEDLREPWCENASEDDEKTGIEWGRAFRRL